MRLYNVRLEVGAKFFASHVMVLARNADEAITKAKAHARKEVAAVKGWRVTELQEVASPGEILR